MNTSTKVLLVAGVSLGALLLFTRKAKASSVLAGCDGCPDGDAGQTRTITRSDGKQINQTCIGAGDGSSYVDTDNAQAYVCPQYPLLKINNLLVHPLGGGKYRVSFAVQNIGIVPANNFRVNIDSTNIVPSRVLAAGGTYNYDLELVLNLGTHTMIAGDVAVPGSLEGAYTEDFILIPLFNFP